MVITTLTRERLRKGKK